MNNIGQSSKRNIRLNNAIACRVIELHHLGYEFDFQIFNNRSVLCLQDNNCTAMEDLSVRLVDMGYDQLSHSFKYIHTVETSCGKRGLLLADKIAGLGLSQSPPPKNG